MPEVNTIVNDLDDNVSSDDDVSLDSLTMNVESVAVSILSGNWKNGNKSDEVDFVETFREFYTMVSTLRTKLDQQIWDGWDDGSLSHVENSIRNRRKADAQKPGRKAEPKSLKDVLLKK